MTIKLTTIWVIVILICCVGCFQTATEPLTPTSIQSSPTPTSIPPTPTPIPPTPTPNPPTPTPVPPTPTPEPDLLSLVEAYLEAHNRHDLEAGMAFFVEDAALGIGSVSAKGQEQIRTFHEHQFKLNAELQHDDCSVEENTVICQAVLSNDWEQAVGINKIQFTPWTYTFEAGLIQQVSATPDPETEQILGWILADFKLWAAENHQSEFTQLFSPDGQIIHSGENAVLLVSLVEEWRAAVEPALTEALASIWTVEGGGLYLQYKTDGTWRVSFELDALSKSPSLKHSGTAGEWWFVGTMFRHKDLKSSSDWGACPKTQTGSYTVDIVPEKSLGFNPIHDACGDRQYNLTSRHWIAYSP